MPAPSAPSAPRNSPATRSTLAPRPEPTSIFEETWQSPRTQTALRRAAPVPTNEEPPAFQMSGRNPQRPTPSQIAAAKRAAKRRAYEAAGIRSANYQQ
jgi:hypothetical protein